MADPTELAASVLPQNKATFQLLVGLVILFAGVILAGAGWYAAHTANSADAHFLKEDQDISEIKSSIVRVADADDKQTALITQRMTNDEAIQQKLVDAEIPSVHDSNEIHEWEQEHEAPAPRHRERRHLSMGTVRNKMKAC